MKLFRMTSSLVFTSIAVVSFSTSARTRQVSLELGEAQVTAGCHLRPSKIILKSAQIQMPMKLKVELDSSGSGNEVARKSCVISLPIDVPPTHALQIEKISIDQSQTLAVGSKSDLQVEVFKTGSQAQPLKIENEATKKPLLSKSTAHHKTSVLFACGQGGILRVNATATLTSTTNSESAAKLSDLKLSYKLIPCGDAI
ncbi:MAG: DUF4360 domain-containing protein [Pseudobdellovibrionaceae bacterium]